MEVKFPLIEIFMLNGRGRLMVAMWILGELSDLAKQVYRLLDNRVTKKPNRKQ